MIFIKRYECNWDLLLRVSGWTITCHPISLSGSRQVVLLAMMRFSQFEEILQPEKLTDALPDGATRHQSVSSIIHQ